MFQAPNVISACAISLIAIHGAVAGPACEARSAASVTPVVELYTSEGCSSCPPADRWLSSLVPPSGTPQTAVVQSFHVAYWDYIGWVDRFAKAEHAVRQRQIAAWNRVRTIYTPQVVLNGVDWREWRAGKPVAPTAARSAVDIYLRRLGPDHFEASVASRLPSGVIWGAYWTVTEHGHRSKVRAGENNGESLQHDFVVRQYVPLGHYSGDAGAAAKLVLRALPVTPGHARQINLVVFDSQSGKTLQAVSAAC